MREFLAVTSAGGYFRPSNRSPQSPQQRIFTTSGLCVKLTFPNVLLQPFKENPRTGAVDSRPPSFAPAETPSCGHPQGALPQSVTSAWPPRWGRRCGEEAAPRSSSPASTAAGRCGRGAEEDAKPQCRIYTGFFFVGNIPCVQQYLL